MPFVLCALPFPPETCGPSGNGGALPIGGAPAAGTGPFGGAVVVLALAFLPDLISVLFCEEDLLA